MVSVRTKLKSQAVNNYHSMLSRLKRFLADNYRYKGKKASLFQTNTFLAFVVM